MGIRKPLTVSMTAGLLAVPVLLPAAVPGAQATSRACAAYPAFPDAGCTGPTADALPRYTGPTDFDVDGQVIENVEIHAVEGIRIEGDNVTFRNVRIVWDGPFGENIINSDGSGTTFEDCIIDGRGSAERAIAANGRGITVRGCEISGVGNAIETETPLTVEENYIHDIHTARGADWHADGVQVPEGADNVTVRHNTIMLNGPETGAVFIAGDADDPNRNVLITQNLLAGGGYTMYTGYGPGYSVIDNHMSTRIYPKVGFYNIWYTDDPNAGEVRSGNVIHETGAPADRNL